MMRGLLAGASGIRNHQVQMDVIGNNIANINTVGYKASRITFEDALSLLLQPSTKAAPNTGGVNPVQVGTGVSTGSIDIISSQGALESTANETDLALWGDGFFIVNDGKNDYYTRTGAFSFNAEGKLVNSNGFVVQGWMAKDSGEVPPLWSPVHGGQGAQINEIKIPSNQGIKAKATTTISYSGNLDTQDSPLGTITNSGRLLAVAQGGDEITGLYSGGNANGFLNLTEGSTSIAIGDGTNRKNYIYGVNFRTLTELANAITTDFGATGNNSLNVAVGADGELIFTALTANVTVEATSQGNSILDAAFFSINGKTLAAIGDTASSDRFSHIATAVDPLVSLRDFTGTSLSLEVGDDITLLSAKTKGEMLFNRPLLADITNASTLEDLRTALASSLFGAAPLPGEAVVIDTNGAFKITGTPGEANAITEIKIGSGPNPGENVRNACASALTFSEAQKATDVIHTTSITAYDSLGEEHSVLLTFKRTDAENQWTWEAKPSGTGSIIGGNSGKISFNPDGSLANFSYNGDTNAFRFNPNNGASPLSIAFEFGQPPTPFGKGDGEVDGVTQFASPTTVMPTSQNGNASGKLNSISIDNAGRITGSFTNGVTLTLAQIALAKFNNPSGLIRVGDSLYDVSPNSGEPQVGVAGERENAAITSRALEMSNVDLTQEFTKMILAQRGFQANSRVITTADEMLTEVINLRR